MKHHRQVLRTKGKEYDVVLMLRLNVEKDEPRFYVAVHDRAIKFSIGRKLKAGELGECYSAYFKAVDKYVTQRDKEA